MFSGWKSVINININVLHIPISIEMQYDYPSLTNLKYSMSVSHHMSLKLQSFICLLYLRNLHRNIIHGYCSCKVDIKSFTANVLSHFLG